MKIARLVTVLLCTGAVFLATGTANGAEWRSQLLQAYPAAMTQIKDLETVQSTHTISQDLADFAAPHELTSTRNRVRWGDTVLEWRDWPKRNRNNLGVVMRWAFSGKGAHYLLLPGAYDQVLLDGEALRQTPNGFWIRPDGSQRVVTLDGGEHTLIAKPLQPQRRTNTCLIIPEAAGQQALDQIRDSLSDVSEESGRERLVDLLRSAAHHGGDGSALADGLASLVLAASDRNWSDLGSDITRRLAGDATARFAIRIWRRLGPETCAALFTERHSLMQLAEGAADLGAGDISLEYYQLRLGLPEGNDRAQRERSHDVIRFPERLMRLGLYAEATRALAEADVDDDANQKRLTSLSERLELAQRAQIRLIADPDAERALRSFQDLLSRDASDPRTISALYESIRDQSALRLRSDDVVQRLGPLFKTALQRHPTLKQTLHAHVQERVGPKVAAAMQQGDLPAVEDILRVFGPMLDVMPIHRQLLDEYLDRCAFDAARAHANALLRSDTQRDRIDGYSGLLCIEDAMHLPPQVRTPIPENLHQARIDIAGDNRSLLTLQQDFLGASVSSIPDGGPGSLLTNMSLPEAHPQDQAPDAERATTRQALYPRRIGDRLVFGDPRITYGLDAERGALVWSDRGDWAHQVRHHPGKTNLHPVSFAGGQLIVPRSDDDGTLTLVAFNRDGQRQWRMDPSYAGGLWHPLGAPQEAFGSCFVLVSNDQSSDQLHIGIARLDSRSGKLLAVDVLDSIAKRDASAALFFDQRLHATPDGLYGIVGSGAIFKLDPTTLEPEWVRAIPGWQHGRIDDPATYIKVIGQNLICYLPSVSRWQAYNVLTGSLNWTWHCPQVRYIHSRDHDEHLLVSLDAPEQLLSIDAMDGSIRWRTSTLGRPITGEGCVQGSHCLVPVRGGILRLGLNGGLEQFLPVPGPDLNRILAQPGLWCLL
ncbi:MAG: hypothetical protein ACOCXA_06375, partial [Planctomycetota bacterium]